MRRVGIHVLPTVTDSAPRARNCLSTKGIPPLTARFHRSALSPPKLPVESPTADTRH